jgi:FkbM family methyltransferase
VPSIDVMQLFLEFDATEERTFLQIGAFDGKTLDAVFPCVQRWGWRGILVEPQPDAYERLVANYSKVPNHCHGRLRFENAAISDISGTIQLWRHSNRDIEQGRYFAGMLCSSSYGAVYGNAHGIKGEILPFTATAMTVSQLFGKYTEFHQQCQPYVDYVFVDTEGMDVEIVQQVLKLFQPRMIRYENWRRRSLGEAVIPEVEAAGYSTALVGFDVVCIKQNHWLCQPSQHCPEELLAGIRPW